MLDGLEFVKKNKLRDFIFTEEGGFVRMPNGLEFWFDPTKYNGMIHPLMFSDMRCDIEEVTTLQTILKNISNSIIIDAGAGYGDYACGMAFNTNAIVYAFEPELALYSSLVKTAQHNKLDKRVHCYNLALADKEGFLDVKIPNQKIIFPTTTIDNLIEKENVERVDFIKADIEGAELNMLKGSVGCLKKFKPHLLLEIVEEHSERMGNSVDELLKFLHEFGYENCAYVTEKEQIFINPIEDLKKVLSKEYNFFFWHKDKKFNL
ncbi:MAG: FkbM family methyltransferase [Patescibacteria group bacterium]